MRETIIDGIPAFVADGPSPLSAGLVFGVGRRDESVVRGGLTHLVEHLTMAAVGRMAIDVNASVDLTATEFVATGPADRVAAFLHSVCLALADLPLDRLAVEADVLRTEGGQVAAPAAAALLGELYGATGPGLAGVRDLALRSLTAADVRTWVQRYFIRQNAALWASGPGLDDLRLPLPDGAVPARSQPFRRQLPTPGWSSNAFADRVALAAELPRRPGLPVTVAVLRERVEDELRHRRGLAYAVGADLLAVAPDSRVLVLSTDARPGQEGLTAGVLWREVCRLADEGPRPEELAHQRAVLDAELADPRSVVEEARATAHSRVTGIPATSSAKLRSDAAALTGEDVRTTVAAVRDAAVLAVPEPLEPAPPQLSRLPEWSGDTVTGREFRPRRRGVMPAGARLVVGEDGASLLHSPGEQLTVRWCDAVGLVRSGPDEWVLIGRDGFTIRLAADDWRDGAAAIDLARAAVPADLQVADDDALTDDQILLVRAPEHRTRELVAAGRRSATLAGNDEWTALVPGGDLPAEHYAHELTGSFLRRPAALVLRIGPAHLECLLLTSDRKVSRHVWGTDHADPQPLAEATGRPTSDIADLLAATGSPADILHRLVDVLGLPEAVPDLLAGRATDTAQQVNGIGALHGLRAAVRGDFSPPPGTGGRLDRWAGLSRNRPRWWRVLNAIEVPAFGGLAWWLVDVADGDLLSWPGLFAALSVIMALGCLWDTRPPRREQPRARQAQREAVGSSLDNPGPVPAPPAPTRGHRKVDAGATE